MCATTAVVGNAGMRANSPCAVYSHPWYAQRRRPSHTLPADKGALRCAQRSSSAAGWSWSSRKNTSERPAILKPSGERFNSKDRQAIYQPAGVAGVAAFDRHVGWSGWSLDSMQIRLSDDWYVRNVAVCRYTLAIAPYLLCGKQGLPSATALAESQAIRNDCAIRLLGARFCFQRRNGYWFQGYRPSCGFRQFTK